MYLTAQEVRDKFKISKTTYFRWLKTHKLPSPIRLGKYTYFDADSIRKAEQMLKTISERNLIQVRGI